MLLLRKLCLRGRPQHALRFRRVLCKRDAAARRVDGRPRRRRKPLHWPGPVRPVSGARVGAQQVGGFCSEDCAVGVYEGEIGYALHAAERSESLVLVSIEWVRPPWHLTAIRFVLALLAIPAATGMV